MLVEEKGSRISKTRLGFEGFNLTFPVVRARGSKEDEVLVRGEAGSQALLTEPKLLMALRPALTELPLAPIQVVPFRQVLAQHVAAPDGVASLRGLVDSLTEFIQVGARLGQGGPWISPPNEIHHLKVANTEATFC